MVPAAGEGQEKFFTFASDFAKIAGMPTDLSGKFLNVISESAKKVLPRVESPVDVSLAAGRYLASLSLSGRKIPIGVNLFNSADEILALFDGENTKLRVSVYLDGRVKELPNFRRTDGDVRLAQLKDEDIPAACVLWRKLFGAKSPWIFLTSPGKMAQMISSGKLLSVGLYDTSGNLVGVIHSRNFRNPFYLTVLPFALPLEYAGRAREFLNSVVGKLRLLSPTWILWIADFHDKFVRTEIGKMYPMGIMEHHSFGRWNFVFARKLDCTDRKIVYPPEQVEDYISELAEIFDLNLEFGSAVVPPRDEKFRFVLQFEKGSATATLRFVGFGARGSSAVKVITNVFKNLAGFPESTLYIDLPLGSPFTKPLGEKLISTGFRVYGYIPGDFLRFQRTTGVHISSRPLPDDGLLPLIAGVAR